MKLGSAVLVMVAVGKFAAPVAVLAQDQPPACATLSAAEAQWIASKDNPDKPEACNIVCRGCGCKGGPGYRNKQGRCVGYKNLISECGPPPHAGCTRECAMVVTGCKRPDIDAAKRAVSAPVPGNQ